MLGQGQFAARAAQAVDDLDGDDVGRADGVVAMRHLAGDELIQAEEAPPPPGQPDIAEAARVGPTNRPQANAHHVGIVGQGHMVVVRQEPQVAGLPLAVVEGDSALPAALLVGMEFAAMNDDLLAGPGFGAHGFHQGEIGQLLAADRAARAAQKHGLLLACHPGQEQPPAARGWLSTTSRGDYFPLRISRAKRHLRLGNAGKIEEIFFEVRNLG
jgi:hypothetical protein